MIIQQCPYCEINTGGQHEWNCPINPLGLVEYPQKIQNTERVVYPNAEYVIALQNKIIVTLEQQLAENEALRAKLTDILMRTANALEGNPPSYIHGWADLPEVAEQLKRELAERDTEIDELRGGIRYLRDSAKCDDLSLPLRREWVVNFCDKVLKGEKEDSK